MGLKFIDAPRPAARKDYDDAVNSISEKLKKSADLISIIRFGSLTTPGISDIDLLAVFKEGSSGNVNPLFDLPHGQKTLFTHNVDAVSELFLPGLIKYSLLPKMQVIYGENKLQESYQHPVKELDVLKKQIALEYLLTNYVALTIQLNYKTIRLRGLLQHVKGLYYDFEFLNMKPAPLFEMVEELREWIKNWFTQKQPDEKKITKYLHTFYPHYKSFLTNLLESVPLYLGDKKEIQLSRHTWLHPSGKLGHSRKGIILPPVFFAGKKFYKLNNKLNRWKFSFPAEFLTTEEVLEKRYSYFKEYRAYNKKHFPFFHSITTGIV